MSKTKNQDHTSHPLIGLWDVLVTSGEWLGLNMLGDQKMISGDHGHNVIKDNYFGWFKIYSRSDDRFELSYNHHANPSPLKLIRDVIVKVDDNTWAGTFYYSRIPVFQFELHRVKEENEL